MPAEERKPIDSKNSTPAHEIKGKEVDTNKMDKKEPSPKDEIVDGYFHLVMTFSILCFNACPKKSLKELFPWTGLPVSKLKEETRSEIGNLLVVAVLVAGVTFAGVIQLPQLRDNNNSSDRRHEFNSTYTASDYSTYENLLYVYLALDVGALSCSLAAALFLLLPSVTKGFQISAVWFSIFMVRLAIFMMFGAFLFSVRIVLIGSHGWLLTIIITGVAVVFPSIIPLFGNEVLLKVLLHYFYYSLFLVFIYSRWWLPHKLSRIRGRDIFFLFIYSSWWLPNKLSDLDLKRELSDLKRKFRILRSIISWIVSGERLE